jgi:Ice-binding-like
MNSRVGIRTARLPVLLAVLLAAAVVSAAGPADAVPAPVPLGAADSFAVLAGSTVTNTNTPTIVSGDLGVSPGSAVTGFPPGVVILGSIHAADVLAAQAKVSLNSAYTNAAGQVATTDLTGQDLGGLTLTPGVYKYTSSAQLTGTVTLSGNGLFIFQIGSTLTTASGSVVSLSNGAQACNVFWQVGSASTGATLGTGTTFRGNILALTSITANTGATIDGRALARDGAVTLDDTHITKPAACAPPPTAPTAPTATTVQAGPRFTG